MFSFVTRSAATGPAWIGKARFVPVLSGTVMLVGTILIGLARRRQDRLALETLDDQLLRDLGLYRACPRERARKTGLRPAPGRARGRSA